MSEPILIGTRGWEHEDWRGGFYPPELPADWRFGYYSNLLRSVLVPGETWETAGVEDARQWVEDSDPAFRFVLELPAGLSHPASADAVEQRLMEFFRLIGPIRAQVAGLLIRVTPESPPDRAWLEALLELLAPTHPLCADLPGAWRMPEYMDCLARHHAGLFWRTGDGPAPRPGGRLMVALAQEGEPKAQRRLIEALARWQGEQGVAALIFDTPGKAPEQARQARLLAELMMV